MTSQNTALLLVDIQNDFCPGGALAVPDGDLIVPAANQLAAKADIVVLTQDWHPPDHSSFASHHEGREPFQSIAMAYGQQTLWPDHCVQGSDGSAFHADLDTTSADLIVRKGYRPEIDSYSAFFENDRTTPTGLHGYLRERQVTRLVLAGLAYDFCVYFSAMDARRLGYQVSLATDACRAIDLDGSKDAATRDMVAAGVEIATSASYV